MLGNVIHTEAKDMYISRVACIKGGLPQDTTALTVNRLCGSGLQAIVSAAQSITLGDTDVAVGGGVESMSRGGYLMPSLRWGQRMNDGGAIDMMVGALTAYNLALLGLAFSDWYWFSFGAIFVVGLCHAYFLTTVQVTLQTLVEDHYRGRVMSVFTLVWSLSVFSGFLLNTAGAFVGPRFALAGGAAIVLAYVWLSLVRATALRNLVLTPKPG